MSSFLPPSGPAIRGACVGHMLIDCTLYPEDVLGCMNPDALKPYLDRLISISVPSTKNACPLPHETKFLVNNTERMFSSDEWKDILLEIEDLCKSAKAFYSVNNAVKAQLFGC